MTKLGRLALDGSVPVLVASFAATDQAVIDTAVAQGLDVAELRIDLHADVLPAAVLREIAKFEKVPTLATIRSAAEGGKWSGSERERLELYATIVPHVDAVDVELGATQIRHEVQRLTREAGKLQVLSFHDFARTPPLESLLALVDEAKAADADVVKVATQANSDTDIATLTALLLQRRETKLVVIAMGPVGIKSRVFFPALGSLLTFASVNQATAPGQLPIADMVRELRLFYPRFEEKKSAELGIQKAV